MMRCSYFLLVITLLPVAACKKEAGPVYSGTMTINNKPVATVPTYLVEGFHVPTGKKVTDQNNGRDIINIISDFDVDYNPRKIILATNNFKSSFFLSGEFPSPQEAEASFDNLRLFSEPAWTYMGDGIKPGQIWLFRTDDDRYAKIRIISTLHEKRTDMPRPYAECTFEWVFQPDGTKSFPR